MIDTVLRLIDRCIALAKGRQEPDKATYSNFVIPVIQDFEFVHKDYLASFRKYREMILDREQSFNRPNRVMDAIQSDSLFSGDLRSKLYVLHSLARDPAVGRLIASIETYLKGASNDHIKGYWTEADRPYDEMARRGIVNVIRTAFSNGLETVFGDWPDEQMQRDAAVERLDTIVDQLQKRYSVVMREHILLKQRLLKR